MAFAIWCDWGLHAQGDKSCNFRFPSSVASANGTNSGSSKPGLQ